MYECGQCGKQFRTQVNEMGLCLDCFERIKLIQHQDMLGIMMGQNQAAEHLDAVAPWGPQTPRYDIQAYVESIRRQLIMNQIRIQNSQIGIINTGTITNLNQNIKNLGTTNKDLALELSNFSKNIIESSLPQEKKNEILDNLSFVAEEYSKPEDKRNKTVIQSVLSGLGTAVSVAANLAQCWEAIKPML